MKHTLHTISAILVFLVTLVSVSCTKADIEPVQSIRTRQITVTPAFGDLEADIITKSDNRNTTVPAVGECDIYCIVFDNNDNHRLMDGYPKKQDRIEDGKYTFTVPELENATVIFAIYPETVSFRQIDDSYYLKYHFTAEDMESPANMVYASNEYEGNTTSENSSINLDDIVLDRYNFTARMMFDFSGTNPENISGIYVDLDYHDYTGESSDIKTMNHKFSMFTPADMTQETTDGKTWFIKNLSLLCKEVKNNYDDYITTTVYMNNGDYYSYSFYYIPGKNVEIRVNF